MKHLSTLALSVLALAGCNRLPMVPDLSRADRNITLASLQPQAERTCRWRDDSPLAAHTARSYAGVEQYRMQQAVEAELDELRFDVDQIIYRYDHANGERLSTPGFVLNRNGDRIAMGTGTVPESGEQQLFLVYEPGRAITGTTQDGAPSYGLYAGYYSVGRDSPSEEPYHDLKLFPLTSAMMRYMPRDLRQMGDQIAATGLTLREVHSERTASYRDYTAEYQRISALTRQHGGQQRPASFVCD